jgi:glucan 1,3-beta-glucosidase
MALASGTAIGWAAVNVPVESLTLGDWIRSLSWLAVASLSPLLGAVALARTAPLPSFQSVLGRQRPRDPVALLLGALLIALTLLAVQAALGFVFNPRYRDFPFAPLTAAAAPFLLVAVLQGGAQGVRPAAESLAGATLALSAVYIVLNETLANWQAVWFCAGLFALALTLWRARDAPG